MADRRNPLTMNDEQLVAEMRSVRLEIEERAARLAELGRGLYTSARRRDVRREYERLGEALYSAEMAVRTASQDQLALAQATVASLRAARAAQQERITTYTAYSQAWIRFSGMIHQALQRTRSTDRLLDRLPAREEVSTTPRPQVVNPPEEKPPEKPLEEEPSTQSPIEDLIQMYGEESTSDAWRR